MKAVEAEVALYDESTPSWKNLQYPGEKNYPAWILDPESHLCRAVVETQRSLFAEEPLVKPWYFSTNGVSIMGMHNIPCIGYGPGHADQAHKPNEKTWKAELLRACAVYAYLPFIYLNG